MGYRSWLVFAVLLGASLPGWAGEKQVSFDSVPSGAQVELDGRIVGTTPTTVSFPDRCFGRKKLAWSDHVSQPISVRFLKEGFAPKVLNITEGPIHWSSFNRQNQYDYYLISATTFTVRLDSVQEFFKPEGTPALRAVSTGPEATPAAPTSPLSIDQVSRTAFPAIVTVTTSMGSGSGFFITSAGVVATNAHVVKGQSVATVVTSSGKPYQSSSIYVDQDRDLALIKVEAADMPWLPLAEAQPAPGVDVVAIGSPGIGSISLTNTVTRGVVSGIRSGDHGVWIQTDAAINPGNSGGPLLNLRGQVVGINTLKVVARDISGINFALSSSELLQVLQSRFGYKPQGHMASTASADAREVNPSTMVEITSDPAGADIEVDGVFVGNTPSAISMEIGNRVIRITKKGYKPFERKLSVSVGSKPTIDAEMDRAEP